MEEEKTQLHQPQIGRHRGKQGHQVILSHHDTREPKVPQPLPPVNGEDGAQRHHIVCVCCDVEFLVRAQIRAHAYMLQVSRRAQRARQVA
jgi:hypothetical protein